jgi:hypothetical protein
MELSLFLVAERRSHRIQDVPSLFSTEQGQIDRLECGKWARQDRLFPYHTADLSANHILSKDTRKRIHQRFKAAERAME